MCRIKSANSGKAWEFALAKAFSIKTNNPNLLEGSSSHEKARMSFELFSLKEQKRLQQAAEKSVQFLVKHENRFEGIVNIELQKDNKGEEGDVRDILVCVNNDKPIGISAKQRNSALKHSRLSRSIDFGERWYGRKCSVAYWSKVNPVFEKLESLKGQRKLFRDIPDKMDLFYVPILTAFIEEIKAYPKAEQLLSYLIGHQDFYRIIKANGNIQIESFNLRGDLNWGEKVSLPSKMIKCEMKPKSKTTVYVEFNKGWLLSFRIHNARSIVEPSLQFDVKLVSSPDSLSKHKFSYK